MVSVNHLATKRSMGQPHAEPALAALISVGPAVRGYAAMDRAERSRT
jgi:hypothetical protein